VRNLGSGEVAGGPTAEISNSRIVKGIQDIDPIRPSKYNAGIDPINCRLDNRLYIRRRLSWKWLVLVVLVRDGKAIS
jgi:hypothetical protein